MSSVFKAFQPHYSMSLYGPIHLPLGGSNLVMTDHICLAAGCSMHNIIANRQQQEAKQFHSPELGRSELIS